MQDDATWSGISSFGSSDLLNQLSREAYIHPQSPAATFQIDFTKQMLVLASVLCLKPIKIMSLITFIPVTVINLLLAVDHFLQDELSKMN